MSDRESDASDDAPDDFAWMGDSEDPDGGGPPAEFVDVPDVTPGETTDPSGSAP